MKKLNLLLLALLIVSLSSCSVVGGVIKFSFGVGVVAALIVVFLIIWLISAFRGKN